MHPTFSGTHLSNTKKQKTVSRSSIEAEYKAMVDAATEVMWVKTVLHELFILCS
jgi:hypothetical protein